MTDNRQPMETAPKDGSWIVVVLEGGCVTPARWITHNFSYGDHFGREGHTIQRLGKYEGFMSADGCPLFPISFLRLPQLSKVQP